MKLAQIEGNRIHKIYTPEEASWYQGILDLQEVPDEAREGWVWDGVEWAEPEAEAEVIPVVQPFSTAEMILLRHAAQTDPDIIIELANAMDDVAPQAALPYDREKGVYSWTQVVSLNGGYYLVVQPVIAATAPTPEEDTSHTYYFPVDGGSHTGTEADPIPLIAGINCYKGWYYSYNGTAYLLSQDLLPCIEAWLPGKAGVYFWTPVKPGEEWPAWQPGTYPKGAKVSHKGKHWVSQVDGNHWEPGGAGVHETIWKSVTT